MEEGALWELGGGGSAGRGHGLGHSGCGGRGRGRLDGALEGHGRSLLDAGHKIVDDRDEELHGGHGGEVFVGARGSQHAISMRCVWWWWCCDRGQEKWWWWCDGLLCSNVVSVAVKEVGGEIRAVCLGGGGGR